MSIIGFSLCTKTLCGIAAAVLFLHVNLFAQENKTILLEEVEITSSRLKNFSAGLRVIHIDSAELDKMQHKDLGELLFSKGDLNIRSYGPGSLSTISLRGTSSNHTAVYWNGIKLNLPNIGMADLAMVPLGFVESISIQKGGASSLFGSGNIGGSIIMGNKPVFGQKKSLNVFLSAASFANYAAVLNLAFSSKKYYSRTGLHYHFAENNFEYENYVKWQHPLESLSNAAYVQKDFFHHSAFKFNASHFFEVLWWGQDYFREIPPSLTMQKSLANQKDLNSRTVLRYTGFGEKIHWHAKAAHLYYDEIYKDPISSLYSNIRTVSYTGGLEIGKYLKQARVSLGMEALATHAFISSYGDPKLQQSVSWYLFIVHKLLKDKWLLSFNIREEFSEGYKAEWAPVVGIEGSINKHFRLLFNVSQNYRIPTLNDRFWVPGGNSDLEPEKSFNQEINLEYRNTAAAKKLHIHSGLGIFNSIIENWIQWIPAGSYWSPENIKEVWSRGIEARFGCAYTFITWRMSGNISYQKVYSTNESKSSDLDQSFQKQLVFIPEDQYSIALKVNYRKWEVSFRQLYNSKRFVTTDNNIFLDSFHLTDISLDRMLDWKKGKLIVSLSLKNIFNETYELYQYRPMPGRSIECIINLKF